MASKTIFELLTWAFVQEPDGDGAVGETRSAWDRMETLASLGTLVDTSGGGGFMPDVREPHPDAVTLRRAVGDLMYYDAAIPDDWSPLGDWTNTDAVMEAGPSVRAVVERYRLAGHAARMRSLQALVVSRAILGVAPDWSCPEPGLRPVMRNGKPAWFVRRMIDGAMPGLSYAVEVDGWDKRRGRPHPGAYRRDELAEDPASGILSRMDWQLWVAALRRIATDVSGRISQDVAQFSMPVAPWGGICPAIALRRLAEKVEI